ncbi:MAG: cupin domain-containing protein [Pseudomonadota bacterium]|nr:cupin domain-containing protein [Pseudomonadota bacterium]
MTDLLKRLDTTPGFTPREAKPTPERLIEGSPEFKTWALDEALAEAQKWGRIDTGIWEATPGLTHSIKGDTFEFCHILSGVVEIIEKDGDTQRFVAGDSFVMKPGFVGRWKTIETVRKIYVTAS